MAKPEITTNATVCREEQSRKLRHWDSDVYFAVAYRHRCKSSTCPASQPHNLTTSQPHNLRRFECWSEQRKTESILLGYIETENAALPDGYHSPITLPSARRAVSRRMTRPVFSLTNRTAPSHSRNEHHRHGWKNILLEYVRERRLLYQR